MKKGNIGFTLVELIVVITILAILGTIAFISLQWHSRNARDSVRVSDMATIHKWIWVLLVRWGIIPTPDDRLEVHSSWTLIWYQWDAWKNVLSSIGMIARWGKDPVDDTYYSYMTNKNLTSYQLLWYLEWWSEIGLNVLNQAKAVEYDTKFKKVEWDSLWILTQWTTEIPIHRVDTLISAWSIDVKNTTDTYVANFDDTVNVSGTWASINTISNVLRTGWIKNISCKYIKLLDPDTTDWVYAINPTGWRSTEFDAYCDMTTDGWWWTLIGRWREWWDWNNEGKGESDIYTNISTSWSFIPAYYSSSRVDDIIWVDVKDLNDGVRLRRVVDLTGSSWQEVRWKFSAQWGWSWLFDNSFTLSDVIVDGNSVWASDTIDNIAMVANGNLRVFTWAYSGHNLQEGFSYGVWVRDGTNTSSSFLWEYADEDNAIPYTEVYVRD